MFKRIYENKTPKYVISTEQFTITIASSSATGTVTLTKRVDTTTSFITFDGATCASANTQNNAVRVSLTDGITVTATRNTADTNAITVTGTVIYCSPQFVKKIQSGTITMTGTSTTATITDIRTDKSVVLYQGYTTNNANANLSTGLMSLTITNSTTITAAISTNGTTCIVGYVVIEFQPNCICSIQQVSITAASGTSATATLSTSVDMNNSLCFYGGQTSATNTRAQGFSKIVLTNSTTVTASWNTSTATTRTVKTTVVNFAPKVIRSIRRGTTTISATTSATSTIDFVDVNYAWCMLLGFDCTGISHPAAVAKISLTNGTTITATLNSSGTDTVAWEVGWFN